ncbi:putative HTH-type transcriptional regulator [compost metagenome]
MNQLRVEALRRLMGGLTQAEFADRHDLNASYISQILSGHRAFGERAARNMETKIGISPGTLSRPPLPDGELELDGMDRGQHANVTPIDTHPRKRTKYPVISWVNAGDWAESSDNYQAGDADEWLESEEKAGAHGYWLEVEGDSMLPLFPQGCRILVQPEGFDLVSGKYYVAVCYEPGRKRDTTVKQYVRDAGFEYLKPLNPSYRTLDVSENIRIIGRVVDYKLPRGVL